MSELGMENSLREGKIETQNNIFAIRDILEQVVEENGVTVNSKESEIEEVNYLDRNREMLTRLLEMSKLIKCFEKLKRGLDSNIAIATFTSLYDAYRNMVVSFEGAEAEDTIDISEDMGALIGDIKKAFSIYEEESDNFKKANSESEQAELYNRIHDLFEIINGSLKQWKVVIQEALNNPKFKKSIIH